jgi:hypothetical protein
MELLIGTRLMCCFHEGNTRNKTFPGENHLGKGIRASSLHPRSNAEKSQSLKNQG